MATSEKPERSSQSLLIVASAVLVFFGIVVTILLQVAGSSNETTWSRLVFVYSGVEAVVFAAAGALFGTQIQRAQTVAAEERASAAEELVDEARNEAKLLSVRAANGAALKQAIEATEAVEGQPARSGRTRQSGNLGGGRVGSGPPPEGAPAPAGEMSGSSTAYLAELARRLFPE